ncbi:MAG: FG-GAP-like repeat-containing protein [Pseudomonadota bacterium]
MSFIPSTMLKRITPRNLGWLLWCLFVVFSIYLFTPGTVTELELRQPDYDINKLSSENLSIDITPFINKTLEAGITNPHSQKSGVITGIHESLGAGVCSFDLNRDGWLDIITINGSGNTHFFGKPKWWQKTRNSVSLYLNNKDGTFSDITPSAKLVTQTQSMGCAVADLNVDGYQDVLLLNRGKNEVWINSGNQTFSRLEKFEATQSNVWTSSASIADVNNDGLPDIYFANFISYVPNDLTFEASAGQLGGQPASFDAQLYAGEKNQLLINKGSLNFEDQTDIWKAGNLQGRSLSASFVDINGDNRLDLLIANDGKSENKLLLNAGSNFEDVTSEYAIGTSTATTSMFPVDFDNDGKSELLLTHDGQQFTKIYKYVQSSAQQDFVDVSDNWGLNVLTSSLEHSWPPAVADFNMDGWLDVLVPNGLRTPNQDSKSVSQSQPGYLLLNKQGREFSKYSAPLDKYTLDVSSSRCAISGDFNNDGRPDALIAVNNGLPHLFTNELPLAQWIGFDLSSLGEGPPETGDHIELVSNQRTRLYDIRNGTHGSCWQENSRFSVGLAPGEEIERLILQRARGDQQEFSTFAVNKYNLIDSTGTKYISAADPSRPQINLVSDDLKPVVIEWLIHTEQNEQAYHEILALMKNDDSAIRLRAAEVAQKLPRAYQAKLVPAQMRDENNKIQLFGLKLIHSLEDDRLAGWLFSAIAHDDPQVSCAAMKTLEFFYQEEEAAILTKYAGIDPLIRSLEDGNLSQNICAISALGEAERYRALAPLMTLLNNDDHEVRLAAIKALGRIRDGKAAQALIDQYKWEGESSVNRFEILRSLTDIDPEFEPSFFVIESLSLPGRASHLRTLAEAAADPDKRSFLEKTGLVSALLNWSNEDHRELSELETLYVLEVALAGDSKHLKRVEQYLQHKSQEVRFRSLTILANYKAVTERTQYLQSLIASGNPGIELLHSYTGESFTKPEVITLLANTDKYDQIKLLQALVKNMRQSTIVASFYDIYEILGNTTDKKNAVGILINHETLTDPNAICNLELLDGNPVAPKVEAAIQVFKRWDASAIDNCYRYATLESTPALFSQNTSSSPSIRELQLAFIAKRSEAWARRMINAILTDPLATQNDLVGLIDNLPDNLLSSQSRAINRLFTSHKNRSVRHAAYQKLAKSESWVMENAQSLGQSIDSALEVGKEEYAINVARESFNYLPGPTLEKFMSSAPLSPTN